MDLESPGPTIDSRDACKWDELKTFDGRANSVSSSLSVLCDVFGCTF
jgi:hypothetical protein